MNRGLVNSIGRHAVFTRVFLSLTSPSRIAYNAEKDRQKSKNDFTDIFFQRESRIYVSIAQRFPVGRRYGSQSV